MKRHTPTQAEIQQYIARFNDIVPVKSLRSREYGIPEEVFEMQTAKITRNIMSPGPLPGQLSPKPVVVGGDKGVFRLGIVTCPAHQGPGLHVHYKTYETFMALTGRWEIQWGDHGEESIVLEPFDLIAMPPGVTRRFVNVSDSDAHLFVLIQGQLEDFDDVDRDPATAEKIAAKYGTEMVKKLNDLGYRFTIGIEDAPEEAREA